MTPEQIEEIKARAKRGIELLTRDRDAMVSCHSQLEKSGDDFAPVAGTLDPECEDDLSDYSAAIEAIASLISALEAANKRMAELEGLQKMIDGVKEEATAEGRGFWKPCTGCHESEMGQTTLGGWSKMFSCEQGVGCLECGGLGVLWDSEDYEDMAEWMRQEDKKEAGRKAELTALRARVAELEGAVEAERDALKDVLTTVRALRAVEALAPAIHNFEIEKRSEVWARVDEMIEAALKDGGRD